MKPTQLLIVRHGETLWNIQKRIQGQQDSELTETGIAQAHALVERFREDSFSALYSSDLGRAYRTAEIVAAETGHMIHPDPRLRERHFGIFHGLTWEEAERVYPEERAAYLTDGPDYVIPEGESARECMHRSVAGLEEIARRHPGETVLIVTHGGVLSGLFRYTLGIPLDAPRHFTLWNTSLSLFFYGDDGWKLESWGDIGHLPHTGVIDDL